ncbi:hypothetical protein MettiDRAFT_0747 [Methanolobus tindarius DSM 2278]|uniref:Uncharacterized protein n=1 Tax=Methanolobus tindarius DSM 2278 TaxID=1090322 RepID=W9DUG7_METTI|nr:MarR family transcriptional regulator [Methanolobus tindarius]ETA67327.1 hypothetical protein MettiDRAFT_0747 [Methanolobus tindarius DSM 2278]
MARSRGNANPIGKTKKEILLFLLNHDGKAKKGDIREYLRVEHQIRENKGVSNHLEQLVKIGLIYKDPHFKNGMDLYFFITDDFNSFVKIYCENFRDIDQLITSNHFIANAHQLVDTFANSIPKIKTLDYLPAESTSPLGKDDLDYLRDTCNLKTAKIDDQLTPEDKKQLTNIICNNVLAFKFVLNFINSDKNAKLVILGNIIEDVNDSMFSPYPAWIEGYMSGIEDVELRYDVPEEILESIFTKRMEATEQDAQHYWIPFFYILERMNKNYPYLFG